MPFSHCWFHWYKIIHHNIATYPNKFSFIPAPVTKKHIFWHTTCKFTTFMLNDQRRYFIACRLRYNDIEWTNYIYQICWIMTWYICRRVWKAMSSKYATWNPWYHFPDRGDIRRRRAVDISSQSSFCCIYWIAFDLLFLIHSVRADWCFFLCCICNQSSRLCIYRH